MPDQDQQGVIPTGRRDEFVAGHADASTAVYRANDKESHVDANGSVTIIISDGPARRIMV